jgi:arsenite-transporting ATPase
VDQKLKSSTVSNWIVSTKFFQSLVLLTPGLSYLIFMGHIISKLRKDPEKIIIFDSPASGHFLTLFQSIWNFHRVFRKGMLFKDTDQIVRFLKDDRNLSVLIVTLPNSVSFQESSELAKELFENFEMNSELIFNNCLSLVYQDSKEDIASTFLKHKLEFEYAIESKLPENTLKIPLVLETDRESIIKSIESYLEKMYND